MFKSLLVISCITFSVISCKPAVESKEVLFVCTHGAARSPIAAAYFNKLAKENKLRYHATYRGTEPDETLSKETIKGLTDDGFEVSSWKPEKVSKQDIKKAYQIVTFDCSISSTNSSVLKEEWNGTPSISKDYINARNAIKIKVQHLIDDLVEDSN